MRGKYDYEDKKTMHLSVVYKGKNLWFISCCMEFFFVAGIGREFAVYEVINDEVFYFANSFTLEGTAPRIKEYIQNRDNAF